MNLEDYEAAYEGRVGADRMAERLPIVVDPLHGDLEEIRRLRDVLRFIAKSTFCYSLDIATEAAQKALE